MTKKLQAALMIMALSGTGIVLAERATNAQNATAKPVDVARPQLEAQMLDAKRTAQTYHAMDNPTLLTRLSEQSTARREPFNSLAYRELKGRSDVDPTALASMVRAKDNGDALLPLLLLRQQNEKSYLGLPVAMRAKVLTDGLQTSVKFNTWGMPGFYLEDASKAMIESGRAALPALRRMLSDTRPAPVFGSQQYMVYQRYRFRVCDYAMFFIETIGGNANFKMPESVADRDLMIRKLRG